MFFVKREFLQEINKAANQYANVNSTKLPHDRLERVESEVAYLKDDMVTHADAKKLNCDNIAAYQELLQK